MIGRPKTPERKIQDLDVQLMVSAERLTREKVAGNVDGMKVLRGVVDRMLDARLELMALRDVRS